MKNGEQQRSFSGPQRWQRSERASRSTSGTAVRMVNHPYRLLAAVERWWNPERIRTELMDAELWCLCAIGLILFIAH